MDSPNTGWMWLMLVLVSVAAASSCWPSKNKQTRNEPRWKTKGWCSHQDPLPKTAMEQKLRRGLPPTEGTMRLLRRALPAGWRLRVVGNMVEVQRQATVLLKHSSEGAVLSPSRSELMRSHYAHVYWIRLYFSARLSLRRQQTLRLLYKRQLSRMYRLAHALAPTGMFTCYRPTEKKALFARLVKAVKNLQPVVSFFSASRGVHIVPYGARDGLEFLIPKEERECTDVLRRLQGVFKLYPDAPHEP